MFVTPGSRAKKRVSGLSFPISGDGKTVTVSTPLLTLTQTWNSSGVTFTGLKFNVTDTASASGSLLLDLEVGGNTKFAARKDGAILLDTAVNDCALIPYGSGNGGLMSANSAGVIRDLSCRYFTVYNVTVGFSENIFDGTRCLLPRNWNIDFSTGGTSDLILGRDASAVLSQRASTFAQVYRIYNTYTDASNYERGGFDWQTTANVFRIRSENLGTGTNRIIAIDGFDKAGAAAASDIPSGTWALVHDTSGATFKLIYNNGGTLKTVALT